MRAKETRLALAGAIWTRLPPLAVLFRRSKSIACDAGFGSLVGRPQATAVSAVSTTTKNARRRQGRVRLTIQLS
jgi:hypothetical protein